jgi:arabinogalactan oligomer / maltooligosaccharide transport system substrate-binding protein
MRQTDAVNLWHELSGSADSTLRALERICHQCAKETGREFRLHCFDIQEFLTRLSSKSGPAPDVVLIPQDMVNLNADFSLVPDEIRPANIPLSVWRTMCFEGQQRGVPILRGNHAIMYLNGERWTGDADNLESMAKQTGNGVRALAMDPTTAFWVLPFLLLYQDFPVAEDRLALDRHAVHKAFNEIIKWRRTGLFRFLPASDRMIEAFLSGEVDAMINGEWVMGYLIEQLGTSLRVCQLPSVNGEYLRGINSSVGIAFPKQSLESPKREALLHLASVLAGSESQQTFFREFHRIPADEELYTELCQQQPPLWKDSLTQLNRNFQIKNDRQLKGLWRALDAGLGVLCSEGTEAAVSRVFAS